METRPDGVRKARDSISQAGPGKRFTLNMTPMLETEQKAPEFTLPDQDGHDISLTSLLKDGPVILYFYPADFTPGVRGRPVPFAICTARSAARA